MIVSFRTSVRDRHTWGGTLGCCHCPGPPPQLVTIRALPRRRRQVLPHGGNLRPNSSSSSSLPHKALECPQFHRGTSWCMAHRCTALEEAVCGTSERVPTLPMGWEFPAVVGASSPNPAQSLDWTSHWVRAHQYVCTNSECLGVIWIGRMGARMGSPTVLSTIYQDFKKKESK